LTGGNRHQHPRGQFGRRGGGEMKKTLAPHAGKLLGGRVLVHGGFSARIISMNPYVKKVRSKKNLLTVTDLQFRQIQMVDEFHRHKLFLSLKLIVLAVNTKPVTFPVRPELVEG